MRIKSIIKILDILLLSTIEFPKSLFAPYLTFILFLFYNVNTCLIDMKL